MSDNHTNGFPIARVIAVLDASCADIAPVMAATEIAARLGAEVLGLFIEDVNLLRLAASPAARHIGVGLAASASWDMASLEQEMQALAARAEAELGACAARIGVRWSFRVVRGLPAAELETATVMQDLLVIGSARVQGALPLWFGSPVRAAALQLARTVMLVPRNVSLVRPLIVARAGSEQLNRAVAAGVRLSRGRDLDIMLVGDAAPIAADTAAISTWLRARGYGHHVHGRHTLTAAQLAQSAKAMGSDVLVLTADLPLVEAQGEIDELAQEAGCHVLVVASARPADDGAP